MKYIKDFFSGGFIMLIITFCIINLMTLLFVMTSTNIDYGLNLFNMNVLSIEISENSFGYIMMPASFLLSLTIGGIIGLMFSFLIKKGIIN